MIFAIMGVVIALIGLIFQIHSFTNQIKLQNFTEYTRRYQDIVLHLPENINSKDFDIEKLSAELKDNTLRYLRAYYDLC